MHTFGKQINEKRASKLGEKHKEKEMMAKEALVVCSDKSLNTGITIWDMETGDRLLHIPTCASPPHGLLCLKNHFLVASQVNKHGSIGGGVIFVWPLNKPQAPVRNYPVEAVRSLCCTLDGSYLAGGTHSGNAYVWEVSSGRMLRIWRAHKKSINCMKFSSDNSLLISGSNDGEICVWSTISLLDSSDCQSMPSLLHSLLEHNTSVTSLLTLACSSSLLISSSLDGTCKTWELITGKLIRTQVSAQAITAIALDPEEQFLFSGCVDGRIFINMLDAGLEVENVVAPMDQCLMVLSGHKGSITALSFSISGLFLISASEDSTIRLWDAKSWEVIRTYNHHKGRVTNVVIILQSQLLPVIENYHRFSYPLRVSPLDKYPKPENTFKEPVALLPSYCSLEDDHMNSGFHIVNTMNQQIMDLEEERTPEALQMKVDVSVEKRLWATSMAKHITDMNKHLRSRLLDLMQSRLSCEVAYTTIPKSKKCVVRSASPSGEKYRGCST